MADLYSYFISKNKIKLIQITNIEMQWGLKINPKYFLKALNIILIKRFQRLYIICLDICVLCLG